MELTEKSYASKGVGGTALGLAIGSLGAQVLGGGLGNLFGGGAHHCDNSGSIAALAALSLGGHASGNGENTPVNRYELGLQKEITNKDMEIAYLKGRDAAKSDTIELYRYIDGKLEAQNAKIAEQAVFNATVTATMNCMGGQIAQLFALTKLVIPNASVCPGWGNVTVAPATAAAAG
jgi:hypothetical protein